MCCKSSILKIAVFGIGLALGLAAVAFFAPPPPSLSWDDALTVVQNRGGGSARASDPKPADPQRILRDSPDAVTSSDTVPLKIISKPKAPYTDVARNNNTQGSVTLKIVFLASGEIGSITVVSGLPDGLTEQAIAAAKQIKFEPKRVNGQPVSVVMTFQYGFNIY